MDLSDMGLDTAILSTLHDLLDFAEDGDRPHTPSRAYVRDAKAMAKTPADVKEYPNSYQFVIDMPGIKPVEIKVQVEDNNVLVVSGERKRDREKESKDGVRYLRMERRAGKFMRKFNLPENVKPDAIHASVQDGVLTVTAEKRPPPEPKKPKTIEVKVGSGSGGAGAGAGSGASS
ncbi:Alpha crystallin/Hsp20 domain [Dillenia turbinata]|uniref:Alpha crystallin/Hsp20 domain n=1 Tax=Dillenia turbinata TaxID=194707 RepID=A0AAN8UKH7_9MAGN